MKLTLKDALAAIILVLSFAAPVAAGPFEDAIAAHSRGDYATAMRGLRQLADQGDDNAQYNLGIMYFEGHGVPKNDAEAVKWYRLAANQGNAAAQYNLGVIYAEGYGVPQDYAEAAKLYRLSADQGDALAQSNLGFMYSDGKGVSQNYVRAHMWFNLSAARGDQIAKNNRDLVEQRMTAAQIAEAQKLAREWKPKLEK